MKAGRERFSICIYVLNMSSPLMREKRHSEVTEGSLNYNMGRGGREGERARKRGREGEREGEREGGREGGREEEREGERVRKEILIIIILVWLYKHLFLVMWRQVLIYLCT